MNKMRWRYGDTNPVIAAVKADTIIEIGDLLWQDMDEARPASDSLSVLDFSEDFLGVAMQHSIKGCTATIRVATTGVFEFHCAPKRWELGDLICPAYGENLILLNQQVSAAYGKGEAIGRVAKFQHGTFDTSVLVDIRSTIMAGGIQ